MALGTLTRGALFAKRFRVEEELAEGGFGAIYRVFDEKLGAYSALKVLQLEMLFDDAARERFTREARLTPSNESEHVVRVLDTDVTEGVPWILMELLEGMTLRQRIEAHGPFDATQTAHLFRELCHGVGRAHARGIVHRDLKPDNIFLHRRKDASGGWIVKVLDFGVARALETKGRSAQASIAVRTPGWSAPEQSYHSEVSAAADVWSLGALAFYVLVGRAFTESKLPVAESIGASRHAAVFGRAPLLPAGFDAWFARATATVPQQRFPEADSACAALLAVLAPYVATTPSVPTPALGVASTIPVSHPPLQGRSRSWILSLVLVVVGVSGLGIAVLGPQAPLHFTAAPPPVPLDPNSEVNALLHRWRDIAILRNTDATAIASVYAPAVRFHSEQLYPPRDSMAELRTRWNLRFQDPEWTFAAAALDTATITEEPLEAREVHVGCRLSNRSASSVQLIRIQAASNGPRLVSGTTCTHLEGVYLLRAVQTPAGLRICFESWSQDEAVCPSCPTAPLCARPATGH